jgi:hypothetical protein
VPSHMLVVAAARHSEPLWPLAAATHQRAPRPVGLPPSPAPCPQAVQTLSEDAILSPEKQDGSHSGPLSQGTSYNGQDPSNGSPQQTGAGTV